MAATGFTPISLYYSTTASAVPLAANLANGELALNTADMKLYSKNSSGVVTLLASSGGATGTVSSVAQSFTGGLISVAGSPVTTSGTLALTVAGTSGGIPYFSSASTWATSAALAANALVVGGGAGVAPATVTTGTGVVTALGVAVGTAGAFVVNGGVLGTPSSGTLTNCTFPTLNQNTTGNAATATTATNLAGGSAGTIPYQSAAGTTVQLTAGTAGYILQANGAAAPSWVVASTAAGVNNGTLTLNVSGTGLSGSQTFTANQSTAATFTVTSNATNLNTASTIVARDASGNFSAGTITASLSGNATNVTGIVAVLNGGSGSSTAQGAINTFAGAVTSGSYLRGNGTNVVMSTIQAADVPTLNQNTTGTAANVTGTVAVANGGTGQTTYTNGQLLIGNTTGNTLTKATLTPGTGISITNGTGTITISSSVPAAVDNSLLWYFMG